MRVIFVGASRLTLHTARLLLERGHDVVVIEKVRELAASLNGMLPCGVIQGDGSTPAILKEADPANSDYLFCVTDNDQTNIIASLVGRSLGFRHVVTRIDDPEFQHICIELGLEDTIIPSRTISRYLAAIVEGQRPISMSAMIKNDAALFSFVVGEQDAMRVDQLALPRNCRLVLLYRGDKFILPDDDTALKEEDEAVVLCHASSLDKLRERWRHAELGRDDLVPGSLADT